VTEFAKVKISFALALLGTLFALHPFVERFEGWGFVYLGYEVKVFHAYSLMAGLLALTVYCYALILLHERPHSWLERGGNLLYGLAVLVVPLTAALYGSSLLADRVGHSHLAWAAPAVALGLGIGWLVLSYLAAWQIHRRLGTQDRRAKLEELARHEVASVKHARELCGHEHHDLGVIEAWKALEARLRRLLLARGDARADSADVVLARAVRHGLLAGPTLELVEELRRHWRVAMSTEPIHGEDARKALSAVRHLLAVLPMVEGHGGK
jgi:hypothetical protein